MNNNSNIDETYKQIVKFTLDKETITISEITRNFSIGFNRATKVIERMIEEGLIKEVEGYKYKVINNNCVDNENGYTKKVITINAKGITFVFVMDNIKIRKATGYYALNGETEKTFHKYIKNCSFDFKLSTTGIDGEIDFSLIGIIEKNIESKEEYKFDIIPEKEVGNTIEFNIEEEKRDNVSFTLSIYVDKEIIVKEIITIEREGKIANNPCSI